MSERKYELTIKAAFLGYVVQSIVNNFLPLLFIQMQTEFKMPLSKITLFITTNFIIQLLVDLLSTPLIKRIGYRISMIISNTCVITGLILLTVLPAAFNDPFIGILISVCFYAIGGGLDEVLVSPIVEACPTKNKEAAMSLLHSFYSWGHVSVVLLSTIFFKFIGINNWRILALLWCIIPLMDLILFTFVPIVELEGNMAGETSSFKVLFKNKFFWIMVIMMVCAGASEQGVNQWSSAFAEKGLGVSKEVGDLLGQMLFAFCMGTSRAIYGKIGERIELKKFMKVSTFLCVLAYSIIIFVPDPTITLLACGLAGFSVGIFWPGTFSIASSGIRNGGTLMFALLALAGDLGCASGPTLAGAVMSLTNGNMRLGIGFAIIFPITMGIMLFISGKKGILYRHLTNCTKC